MQGGRAGVDCACEPRPDGYAGVLVLGPGDVVSPFAFPDVSFTVSDFFA